MIEPYTALCIQNTNFCVRTQEDIQKNLDLICKVIDHPHPNTPKDTLFGPGDGAG